MFSTRSLSVLLAAAIFDVHRLFVDAQNAPPSIAKPLAAQYPPVARPENAYEFAFDPSTFVPSTFNSPLTYQVNGLPPWAHFEWANDFFGVRGTPSWSDLGQSTVSVIAEDVTASANSEPSSFTIHVSYNPAPVITWSPIDQIEAGLAGNPAGAQISSGFLLSDTRGLRVTAQSGFSVGFQSWTCAVPVDSYQPVYYSAFILEDGDDEDHSAAFAPSPLPSWLHFDPILITFTGYAPSDVSSVRVVLGCNDVEDTRPDVWDSFLLFIGEDSAAMGLTAPSGLGSVVSIATDTVEWTLESALFEQAVFLDGERVVHASELNVSWKGLETFPWLTWNRYVSSFSCSQPIY